MKQLSLEKISLRITPACITLLMLLLSAAMSRFGGVGRIMLDLVVMNIFFWSLFIEKSLPYWFLFVLGVLQDSLNGTPPGSSSLLYILLGWGIVNKLRIIQEMRFFIIWMVFIGCALATSLMQWLVTSAYLLQLMPFSLHVLQFGMLCISYPLMQLGLALLWQNINHAQR